MCALGDNYVRLELTDTMRKLVGKLPYNLRSRFVAKHQEHKFALPAFIEFVRQQVKTARLMKHMESARAPVKTTSRPRETTKRAPLAVHAAHPIVDDCFHCGKKAHQVPDCHQFKRLTTEARWNAVRPTRLCFRCLRGRHDHRVCPESSVCGKCGKPEHHTLLHSAPRPATKSTGGGDRTSSAEKGAARPPPAAGDSSSTPTETRPPEGALPVSTITDPNPDGRTMLKLLPVVVENAASTYAFIDGGAAPSLITRDLVTRLGLKGRRCHQLMQTECGTFLCDEVVQLKISNLDGDQDITIDEVFVTPQITVNTDHLMPVQWMDSWGHMVDVKLERLPDEEATVGLIVGLNTSLNRHILEQRHGAEGEPSAYLTKLGWVAFGPTGPKLRAVEAPVHHVRPVEDIMDVFKASCDRDFWEKEALTTTEMSYEDRVFLERVSDSCRQENGKYWVDLPFRDEEPLPNNRDMALKCTALLKRKFEKDAAKKSSYVSQVQKYVDKGYAELVPEDALARADGRVWYLTHHAVQHPTKPKIRVVFNPKTKYKGHALNERLLQGPDLTNTLVGVLLRFRNGRYAVTADIQEMFHQVKVPERDRDVFRFFWWPEGDTSGPPREYRMAAQIFGATSSPSIVNFCLRRTADDFGSGYDEEAARTVYRHFYVDNLLKATDDKDSCKTLVNEVIGLCAAGGFRLNQWTSNDKEILAGIPEAERDDSVALLDLSKDELPTERTLGVHWDMKLDCFTFLISLREKAVTRRGILSVVASVYDPLGLVSPVTLQGKLLLQELCKLELGWDAEVPSELADRWKAWTSSLPLLANLKVRRSYAPPGFGPVRTYQLHHFADASKDAYGVVTYLRMTNEHGHVACCLLVSRARVAPLKRTTIPRLELTAAAVAAQMDIKLRKELDIDVIESVFWTDSTTVLKYLANKRARYHTFVDNRVTLIRELTDVSAWRYVDTANNPADITSRGLSVQELIHSEVWRSGPEFLRQDQGSWPAMPEDVRRGALDSKDPEVKTETPVFDLTLSDAPLIEQLAARYSSWPSFLRHVAWLLRFFNNATKRRDDRDPDLTVEELQRAEDHVWKLVQRQTYASEINSLSGKLGRVLKTSKIRRLNPVMQDGLLRVGGRLGKSGVAAAAKHPLILPHASPVVRLMVRWTHEAKGHCGQNHLMAELRSKYWVVHGNAAARAAIRGCVTCRRLSCRPATQLMADLPEERTCPGQPAFTYTGTDCFGPFLVRQGRSTVKRWGALFTCMSSRAVHVEVLDSMDTDAYINALRRFMARRGPVRKMWSDNGSNLVAAEKEMREALGRLDPSKIERELTKTGVEWHFSPPYASNFGGVWERLIRSIRRALRATCQEQILTDDRLQTLFCEAEAVVNSRPLTRCNDDPASQRPLTPNDLLHQKGALEPFTDTCPKDNYVRRRWRQVQYLSDVFWRRWLREYLPLLQERQQWEIRRRDLGVGDVVLVLDEKSARGSWPMGRVVEVIKSSDGRVRSINLRTEKGIYHRPVNKVCVLLEMDATTPNPRV